MAETLSALAGPASANTDTFNVPSAGAVVGGFCKVDDEYSVVTEIPSTTSVVVRSRGSQGGVATAHVSGAPVVFGLLSDISAPGPGKSAITGALPNMVGGYDIRSVSADGAIDVASLRENTEFLIVKGSLAAITLNQNPKLSQDGLRLRFVARTNFAHTITNAAGFFGGTASASDVMTLATSGATCEFEAQGGKWVVVTGVPA